MNEIKVFPIGKIRNNDSEIKMILDAKYAAGLKGLKDYSHVQILWWLDGCDNEKDRTTLVEKKPYKKEPDEIGVFALRSPERPNPIAVSNASITFVDEQSGVVIGQSQLRKVDPLTGQMNSTFKGGCLWHLKIIYTRSLLLRQYGLRLGN